ncbi:predicted protein [Sclerotinia sclerotiorum 1980 UF-70]|uniref:Uncharacterized protein n=1 Tax=Sclerotinia sclerotiorum (strain ATCC 18683 / 1980 / Ss-1) TaxID=665079 RepID=A7F5A1_SCLS1|nr:predicted protein [Sclerotinia sclerotiorum 1980 UF-70]EDN97922.1 predicted protein [Sclerotinia sclerotiorum 1980 UF-70]
MSQDRTLLVPYSPVNGMISYERHPLYFGEDPKFAGAPEDVDEAWDYLLEPHCVDTIRRSLMCKADVGLYTAYWIGDHNAFPNKELRSESETIERMLERSREYRKNGNQ